MRFQEQINALSGLSWRLKTEIDRMEVLVKDDKISETYRIYLKQEIKNYKENMRINVDAVDILLTHENASTPKSQSPL